MHCHLCFLQVACVASFYAARLGNYKRYCPGSTAHGRRQFCVNHRDCHIHGVCSVSTHCKQPAMCADVCRCDATMVCHICCLQVRSSHRAINGIGDVLSGLVPPSRIGVQPGTYGAVVFTRDVSPTYYPVRARARRHLRPRSVDGVRNRSRMPPKCSHPSRAVSLTHSLRPRRRCRCAERRGLVLAPAVSRCCPRHIHIIAVLD